MAINEKKLIEEVKEQFYNSDCIIELIEEQPKVDEWIPCIERMPENNVNVLTCDEFGNVHIMYHNEKFKHPFNISESHYRYHPVVKWMPLPEG